MTPEEINKVITTQKENDENFSAKDISDTEVYNDVISQSTVNIKTIQLGDVFPTNAGGSVTVTRVGGWDDIDVRHNDIHGYITTVYMSALKIGQIKNPYHPNVYGVGYVGVGPYVSGTSHQKTIEYEVWKDMLRRCYCTKNAIHSPTYGGCTVTPYWHNFQNFALWYTNHSFNYQGYQLDKDILQDGNTVYSPEYCTLVPQVINGVFRDFKNSIRSDELPVGVARTKSGNYKATAYGAHLGTYDSLKDAEHMVLNHKQFNLLSIAEQYKYTVDVRVYYALYALAHTL